MRIRPSLASLLLAILLVSSVNPAGAVVLNFDRLSEGVIPKTYGGLTWSSSTWSLPYAESTSFAVSSNGTYATPHSAPNYLLNGYGVPDLSFEFPEPVHFNGAWLAAPRSNSLSAQRVRFVDDLGHASGWLTLTDTPQLLTANFEGSKVIHVEPMGVFTGVEAAGGWYTMDDLDFDVEHTFTTTVNGTGTGVVNSNPSGYVACGGSPLPDLCTTAVPDNSSFSLLATPSYDSQLTGWGGACSACNGPSCTVLLDSAKSCSATMDVRPLVQVGSRRYGSLAMAFAGVADGSAATVKVQGVHLSEEVRLTLDGGCDATFGACQGSTTVHGTMVISAGYLAVDGVVLAAPGKGSPADTSAPAAPAAPVVTTVRPVSVRLAWRAPVDDNGVAGYQVWRDGTHLATVTATSYLDSGLSAGSAHTYRVRAFDAAGNISAPSPQLAVTTLAAGSATVSAPASAVSGETITVSIDPPTSGVVGSVSIYPMYQFDQQGGAPTGYPRDRINLCPTGHCAAPISGAYTIPLDWSAGSYFFCLTSPGVSCARVEVSNPLVDAGTCTAVSLQGASERKLDVVFVADNFAAGEMETFNQRVEEYRKALLSVAPFSSNAQKLNFWKVERSGPILNADYDFPVLAYWIGMVSRCGGADLVAVIEGPGYRKEWRPSANGVDTPPWLMVKDPYGADGFVHEVGHALGKLADEYTNTSFILEDTSSASLRANRDVAFCPKWCSGNPNTSATLTGGFSCWNAWMTFNTCLERLGTGGRSSDAVESCWNEAADLHNGWFMGIDRCDFGTGCQPGTGCYWNARAVNLFRPTLESIMGGYSSAIGFNPPSVEAIRSRLEQYQ